MAFEFTSPIAVAIYTDSGNRFSNLVTQSANATLVANSWNIAPISVTLTAGTSYWLLYNTNSSNSSHNILYRKANGISGYIAQTFGTWPSPANTSGESSSNSQFSIYASNTALASAERRAPCRAPPSATARCYQ